MNDFTNKCPIYFNFLIQKLVNYLDLNGGESCEQVIREATPCGLILTDEVWKINLNKFIAFEEIPYK